MSASVQIYQRKALRSRISTRSGEDKLGERINFMAAGETLSDLHRYRKARVRYVLLGIPESIGVLANFGKCCTDNTWSLFLSYFLNLQSNRYLRGSRLLCLGHIDTAELNHAAAALDPVGPGYIEQLRGLCGRLDNIVYPVIESVVAAGLCPIIVGGGHNNAYPILKGSARALHKQGGVNCVNCDPHADFRPLEGRHSGNGFSYAYADGYLAKYFIFGLHESYNSEQVIETISNNPDIDFCTFESEHSIAEKLQMARRFFETPDQPTGIECDLDSIIGMPSSAITPSGLRVEEARQFIRFTPSQLNPAYLHLPEGAPGENSYEQMKVGKTCAYLAADFIKAHASNTL
jgi:formiminoglutamase